MASKKILDWRGKEKRDIVKVLPQTGKHISIVRDMGRKARLPGKRVSASGKTYWETRKNRSDAPGKNL